MRYGTVVQACVAAVLYSWLLRAPDAPVSAVCHSKASSAMAAALRKAGASMPGQQQGFACTAGVRQFGVEYHTKECSRHHTCEATAL
jgi:hypothetical protein